MNKLINTNLENEILYYKGLMHTLTGQEGQTWQFDWDDILLTIEDAAHYFAE